MTGRLLLPFAGRAICQPRWAHMPVFMLLCICVMRASVGDVCWHPCKTQTPLIEQSLCAGRPFIDVGEEVLVSAPGLAAWPALGLLLQLPAGGAVQWRPQNYITKQCKIKRQVDFSTRCASTSLASSSHSLGDPRKLFHHCHDVAHGSIQSVYCMMPSTKLCHCILKSTSAHAFRNSSIFPIMYGAHAIQAGGVLSLQRSRRKRDR